MYLNDYSYSVNLYRVDLDCNYKLIKQFHYNQFTVANLLKHMTKFSIRRFYIVIKKHDEDIYSLYKTLEDDKIIKTLTQIFEEAKQKCF